MATKDRFLELTALRPDTPQWLDLRGFLFSGRCEVFANPDPSTGFVVRAIDVPVGLVAGRPRPSVIAASLPGPDRAGESWHFLVAEESVEAAAPELPGWRRLGVTLHTLADTAVLDAPEPASTIEIRLAPEGWEAAGLDLGHLPEELRGEYESELVRRLPLVAALDKGRPVSFCYAPVASETLWDVAVDTLPSHRRRGLAGACFVKLAAHQEGRGLRPVWGSLDRNTPSMRLAARLGFRPAARLVAFVP